MAQEFYKETDGNSVDVTLVHDITGEKPIAVDGLVGVPFKSAESGDTVALRTDGAVLRWQAPSGLSLSVGDRVYVTLASVTEHDIPDGAYSTTAGAGKEALFRILSEKDADDWCDVKLINNS
jgi:predicted RecA/RadA family phage recombinase